MISSRKRLASTLILTCIFIPALSQEPNEAKTPETKLTFEMSKDLHGYSGLGSIKPTHVAQLFVNYTTSLPHRSKPDEMKRIFETSAGRGLSEKQREFSLSSKYAVYGNRDGLPAGYEHFCNVYAVSEDDAKKIAEAVIEFLANKANERMQFARNTAEELRAKIAETKEQISEKQAESEAAKAAYEEMKRSIHAVSSDAEAREEAKTIIKEMSRTLNALNVEIAGIEAKLSAVREYESRRSSRRRKKLTAEGLAKIEQIQIEQTVELAGALARRDAANEILLREAKFYNLAGKAGELHNALYNMRQSERGYEQQLKQLNNKLANPTPDMLPPKVYEDKVTIYPVRVEQ